LRRAFDTVDAMKKQGTGRALELKATTIRRLERPISDEQLQRVQGGKPDKSEDPTSISEPVNCGE
jgi:hypothetical protein